jgi:2-succinyl-5-enolpyruvyl-6-hydroxy-3-cyclohexene-1-carboxylate synthase
VAAPSELAPALALGGPRVVAVRTDQRTEADLARELRRAAERALA